METVEDEGPFDVVWGFSAGAIAAMTLLQYAQERPHEPPLFRAAVLYSQECRGVRWTGLGLM